MSQGALAEAELRTRSVGQADVCAVVVTRHPGLETVDSLDAIAPQVRELLIIDNGSTASELAPIEAAALRLGAQVVRFGVDLGTGAAYNYALESARVQGFKWLATFDQDSRASAAMLARMLRLLNAYPERDQVAVVAPVQADEVVPGPASKAAMTVPPSAPGAAPKAAATVPPAAPGTVPKPAATTPPTPPAPPARWKLLGSTTASGALLNVAAASRVGGFDAELFLDYVDQDFCLRLRRAGFQVLEASEVRMLPPSGRMAIPLSGKPAPSEPHPPVRRYYITRNRMLMWRRYFAFDTRWTLADMRASVREFFSMMLWERELRAKLWMMLRGTIDALRNARGELRGHSR